jgi:DNA-binding transcriptional ArsR family regulator
MLNRGENLSPADRSATGETTEPELGVIADAEPAPVRMIFDVETMRVVADPVRARILEAMAGRTNGSWSVRELAELLAVPQTRLYHHVELLVRHHLIRPVERRIVSRIVETRYRIAARSIQLDPAMFSSPVDASTVGATSTESTATVTDVFDGARREVEAAVRLGLVQLTDDAPAERRLVLDRVVMRLSPGRAAELHERLFALADEFGDDDAPDGTAIGMVLALYPTTLPDPAND